MNERMGVRVNSWYNVRTLEVNGSEASLEIVKHGCACDVCDERFEWLSRKLEADGVEHQIEVRKESRSREKAGQVVRQEERFASSKWIVVALPEGFCGEREQAVEYVRQVLGLRVLELVK